MPARQKARIDRLLRQFGLTNQLTGLRLNSMACVALPTCALALAESERYLPDLVRALEAVIERAGLRDDEIVIRMTVARTAAPGRTSPRSAWSGARPASTTSISAPRSTARA